MSHQKYTTHLRKEIDFLKVLINRFHEQEKISTLELDVAMVKTQEIYEYLLKLKLTPADVAIEKKAADPVLVVPSPAEKKIVPETTHKKRVEEPQKTMQPESVAPDIPEKKAEKQIEEKINPVPEETVVPEENIKPGKIPVEPPKTGNGILAEKISTTYQPINETLAQQKTGNDLSSKLQTAPLSSIALGIGLNDKFLYTRELFKGDHTLYADTIRYIDTAESLGDAMDFIRHHLNWDKDNATAQKFISLVYRKHGH